MPPKTPDTGKRLTSERDSSVSGVLRGARDDLAAPRSSSALGSAGKAVVSPKAPLSPISASGRRSAEAIPGAVDHIDRIRGARGALRSNPVLPTLSPISAKSPTSTRSNPFVASGRGLSGRSALVQSPSAARSVADSSSLDTPLGSSDFSPVGVVDDLDSLGATSPVSFEPDSVASVEADVVPTVRGEGVAVDPPSSTALHEGAAANVDPNAVDEANHDASPKLALDAAVTSVEISQTLGGEDLSAVHNETERLRQTFDVVTASEVSIAPEEREAPEEEIDATRSAVDDVLGEGAVADFLDNEDEGVDDKDDQKAPDEAALVTPVAAPPMSEPVAAAPSVSEPAAVDSTFAARGDDEGPARNEGDVTEEDIDGLGESVGPLLEKSGHKKSDLEAQAVPDLPKEAPAIVDEGGPILTAAVETDDDLGDEDASVAQDVKVEVESKEESEDELETEQDAASQSSQPKSGAIEKEKHHDEESFNKTKAFLTVLKVLAIIVGAALGAQGGFLVAVFAVLIFNAIQNKFFGDDKSAGSGVVDRDVDDDDLEKETELAKARQQDIINQQAEAELDDSAEMDEDEEHRAVDDVEEMGNGEQGDEAAEVVEEGATTKPNPEEETRFTMDDGKGGTLVSDPQGIPEAMQKAVKESRESGVTSKLSQAGVAGSSDGAATSRVSDAPKAAREGGGGPEL